ncbi:carbohydrate porin [Pseudanabaena sp. FACHB-1998]|uniref:iron uptake porin n=1 Tax=Pseudanabaena sp. FACHB-1998 TaxID=2692858 RepID=UPI0016807280|nr:iron uptake porin [Pseudanabaena sp. FACHB-1998]MBD2175662.1 carbohydrate porin [Pseudanabaena sp. FACHB-1998]
MFKLKSSLSAVVSLSLLSTATLFPSLAQAETSPSLTNSDPYKAIELKQETQTTAQNVTSVSQLSDVKPTDWAFTALQSLVERYGCIAGYPDRTYRGNQATSRYEFAAGLNACLDKINEIISAGLADKVSKEDLATLQKLQEEFASELATLRGRVDALDAKVSKLEAQQFSTTTKLRGEAIFGAVAASGGPTNDRSNVIFGDRVRLLFDTSFTGKDLLRTRFEFGNLLIGGNGTAGTIANTLGTNTSRVGFASGNAATANVANMNLLFYRFPAFDGKATFFAGPIAAPDDFFTQITPFASSGQGSISRFGRFDPFFRIGGTSTLIGVDYKFDDKVNLQVGYSAGSAATAAGDGGLFGGTTSIAAQFLFKIASNFDTSIAYANTYLPTGSLNTGLINSTSGVNSGESLGSASKSNLLSGNLVWRINPSITFSTSGTVIFVDTVTAGASQTFTTWIAGFNFPNLFTEGSNGAVLFGQPLKRNDASATPYHLELFYRYQLTKNISITPGVYWVFNPEGLSANQTATVGLLRTTFSF